MVCLFVFLPYLQYLFNFKFIYLFIYFIFWLFKSLLKDNKYFEGIKHTLEN